MEKTSIENLRGFFEKLESRTQKPLSKITISNYVSKLNKLSMLVKGKGWDGDASFLNNAKNVLEKIAESNVSGKKDFLSPVLRLLKHNNANSDLISAYQKGLAEFKNDEYSLRKKNKSKPHLVEASLPYNEIVEKIENFKPETKQDLLFLVIVSIYFTGTLVPRNDLNIVKLASSSKKPKELNSEFNYILIDKEGTPVNMVWNKYKSNHTFGSVKFPIPPPLQKLLKTFVASEGKKNGDLLFTKPNGKEYTKYDFLQLIKNATKAILGVEMGVDLIRQIQITDYYRDGVKSIEEDEKNAMRFLHSVEMHKQYFRSNLAESESESENEKET
jgi:hypothetical protein